MLKPEILPANAFKKPARDAGAKAPKPEKTPANPAPVLDAVNEATKPAKG